MAQKLSDLSKLRLCKILNPEVGRKKTLHIDPAILFSRCSAIAQRIGKSMEPYFKWEMCVVPASLFKDNFTRKPVKSELADALYRDVHVADMGPSGEKMRVVDAVGFFTT